MINRFAQACFATLALMPSANTRIWFTLTCVLATAARYILGGLHIGNVGFDEWVPADSWLIFLGAMSGLDVANIGIKRATYKPSPPAAPDIEDKAGRGMEPGQ